MAVLFRDEKCLALNYRDFSSHEKCSRLESGTSIATCSWWSPIEGQRVNELFTCVENSSLQSVLLIAPLKKKFRTSWFKRQRSLLTSLYEPLLKLGSRVASKVVERQARVPEVTSSNPAQSWAYFFHAETQHINRIEHFEVCESVTQKSESDLRSQVLAHKLTSTILSRAKLQRQGSAETTSSYS